MAYRGGAALTLKAVGIRDRRKWPSRKSKDRLRKPWETPNTALNSLTASPPPQEQTKTQAYLSVAYSISDFFSKEVAL